MYRTADLLPFTANPARLAKHLVARGVLVQLAGGLYGVSRQSKFGPLVPGTDALISAFLKGDSYLRTGPELWNATGLGSTAVFPLQVVYNRKRSGRVSLGGRMFWFRRKPFPPRPKPEWYAVDLIENRQIAGVDMDTLRSGLRRACRRGTLSPIQLEEEARTCGTDETYRLVISSVREFLPEPKTILRRTRPPRTD